MEKELMETVAKHLPAMQMQVLRDELAKVERIPDLEKRILRLEGDLRSEQNKVSEYLRDIAALTARAKTTEELQKERLDLDKFKLETKLVCAETRVLDLKELMNAAFRNPEIHKSFSKSVPINQNGYVSYHTETHEETVEKR